jgi:hypothetical protein
MLRPCRIHLLARFVLAWFVLAVGVAVASPMVQPPALQLVCGAGAVKLLPQEGEQAAPVALTMDCALCAPAVVPPPHAGLQPRGAGSLVHAAPPLQAATTPRALGPPARGPPVRPLA